MGFPKFRAVSTICVPLVLAACDGLPFTQEDASCSSENAHKAVDDIFKEELDFALQTALAREKEFSSYDRSELENAVSNIELSFNDVRTSQDDPDSSRLSCKASILLNLPDNVEKTANETRIMVETKTVRELADSYRLKRSGDIYKGDFDYFIQPTDDGAKVFAEIDDNSASLKFATEVITSFAFADEMRDIKIAEDIALAEEKRVEREEEEAFEQAGSAAFETAKVERELASQSINATWLNMPTGARNDLDKLHSAWVRQMKAKCATEAAGSDQRASMRKAKELECQTRMVRACTTTLRRNTNPSARNWSYCRIR